MKPIEGMTGKVHNSNVFEPLPAGAYVGVVIGCDEREATWSNGKTVTQLVFALDVAEGEHKGYYKMRYDAGQNSAFGNKWKGVFKVCEPNDNEKGTDSYIMDKRIFENFIGCIEESNPGYKWDWNEKGTKGKLIGFIVREREFETQDGMSGVTTEICGFAPAQAVRDGKVKTPKPRLLARKPQAASAPNALPITNVGVVTDEEVPF